METFKGVQKYCEYVIQEIENRFKSVDTMKFSTHFDTFQSLLKLEIIEIGKFSSNFSLLNMEGY